jgi:phosphate transport system permease protein
VEGAIALGATRWETIRLAVLPYGRSGMVSASMLGLGRALGETIAVAMVLSQVPGITLHILQPGGNTIAANIANYFGEAGTVGRGALIATGLILFVITLVVNMAARAIVARRKEFS